MAPKLIAVVEGAVAAHKKATNSYTKEEWLEHKPLIEDLYQLKRRSTADVRIALRQLDFHVNERMIKTRIREWRLDKKHKFVDMRTAVALVADQGSRWSSRSPKFRIRGQIVTYPDILLYFRRKRIANPLVWVKSLPPDGFVASPDVKLLDPDPEGGRPDTIMEEGEVEGLEELEQIPASNTTRLPTSRRTPNESADQRSSLQLINSPKRWDQSIVDVSIIHPYKHLPGDKAIWDMRDYCASYLESPRSNTHEEPQVHRFTTHAYFAHRMQNGMFNLLKGEVGSAISSFEGAFGLTSEIFRNDHPMSLAMLMSVICELNSKSLHYVVTQLVSHVRQVVSALHQDEQPHVLSSLFGVLEHAGADAANLAICSMRTALGYLAENDRKLGSLHWKTLYLKERLCDCLYYLGQSGEGAILRSELLEEQQEKYGKNARNVLWTLTNVADDHLQRDEPFSAELRFQDALDRADQLEGYERANSRFKALEGLAKTALIAADSVLSDGIMTEPQASHERLRQKHQELLLKAVRLYEEAEKEAETWFELKNPRRIRVCETKLKLMSRLDPERRMSVSSRKDSWSVESPKLELHFGLESLSGFQIPNEHVTDRKEVGRG